MCLKMYLRNTDFFTKISLLVIVSTQPVKQASSVDVKEVSRQGGCNEKLLLH